MLAGFADDEKVALKDYIVKASKLYHGLSKHDVKKLACEFGIAKDLSIPANWLKNKSAGEDWLKGFRKRYKDISLRHPEATSLARASVFNKHNVEAFFSNLQQVLTTAATGTIPPQNIYNLDETVICTVQKPNQIFASTGIKQVGRITSAERGENVTLCACINVIDHAFLLVYTFPRVHFKQHMLKGAPYGSLGLSAPSGWMNSDLFSQTMLHFIGHMHASKSNPGLLILDNHRSHLGLKIITLAEKHGLAILTFPSHCSHRLQPLDVTVFGPFKTFYNRFADAWMTTNPRRSISIYEIVELSGAASSKAFNLKNITSAFKATGIFPLNPLIFTEDDFLSSYVTERPSCSFEHAAFQHTTSADEEILLKLHPCPRVSATTSRRPSKQQKSAIITSKSEKLKRFPELVLSSSEDDEDNDDLLLDSTSDEKDPFSTTSEEDVAEIENFAPTAVPLMTFAVVKVYSNANKYRNFVA